MNPKRWLREPGPAGGTCGARWRLVSKWQGGFPLFSGWSVQHCGHPTALRPYYGVRPTGEPIYNNGLAFRHLKDAQAAVLAERQTAN